MTPSLLDHPDPCDQREIDRNLSSPRLPRSLALAVVELEFIGVTSNLDAITVWIEKTDRSVARDDESLRAAHDGNLAASQNRMKLVDDVV